MQWIPSVARGTSGSYFWHDFYPLQGVLGENCVTSPLFKIYAEAQSAVILLPSYLFFYFFSQRYARISFLLLKKIVYKGKSVAGYR